MTCKTCEFYYKEHCCNGASDECAEYVDEDMTCEKWEEKK